MPVTISDLTLEITSAGQFLANGNLVADLASAFGTRSDTRRKKTTAETYRRSVAETVTKNGKFRLQVGPTEFATLLPCTRFGRRGYGLYRTNEPLSLQLRCLAIAALFVRAQSNHDLMSRLLTHCGPTLRLLQKSGPFTTVCTSSRSLLDFCQRLWHNDPHAPNLVLAQPTIVPPATGAHVQALTRPERLRFVLLMNLARHDPLLLDSLDPNSLALVPLEQVDVADTKLALSGQPCSVLLLTEQTPWASAVWAARLQQLYPAWAEILPASVFFVQPKRR